MEKISQKKNVIIAIAGAGMHAAVYDSLSALLGPNQLMGIDLPGHGSRESEPPFVSIQDMAGWLKKRLDMAEGKRVLMGHSMGALVALEAAEHSCVSAVILMGAALKMPVNEGLLKEAVVNPPAAAGMLRQWGVSSFHPEKETVMAALSSNMGKAATGVLAADLGACNIYQEGEARARALKKPVLVISGDGDKLTRAAEGEKIARVAADAEHNLLPACGHFMMLEKTPETAGIIRDFIGRRCR